jgi:uncharacterized protein (DUF736 family)
MSNQYINSGGLFVNDRKEKENHPDYNGKVTVDKAGLYYLKGWKRTTKNGQPMLSLALEYAPDDKQPSIEGQPSAQPKAPTDPVNIEVPF